MGLRYLRFSAEEKVTFTDKAPMFSPVFLLPESEQLTSAADQVFLYGIAGEKLKAMAQAVAVAHQRT
jgi:hypothetical protein